MFSWYSFQIIIIIIIIIIIMHANDLLLKLEFCLTYLYRIRAVSMFVTVSLEENICFREV